MKDALGEASYEYDTFQRPISFKRTGYPSLFYSYDPLNGISSMNIGDNWAVAYVYDFLGRLSIMRTPIGDIAFEYMPGQLSTMRRLPNGIETIWKYRPDGLLESITHTSKDRRIIAQSGYFYRPDGLISAIQETAGEQRVTWYEYDKVQRLVAVRDSKGKTFRYTYDSYGNRTVWEHDSALHGTYTYDWADRMLTVNDKNCRHDNSGNLLELPMRGEMRRFAYTGLNKLKSASTDKHRVEYHYDGNGRMSERIVDGIKERYLTDPLSDIWHPLTSTTPNGGRRFYIWQGEWPIGEIINGKVEFYLQDHLEISPKGPEK